MKFRMGASKSSVFSEMLSLLFSKIYLRSLCIQRAGSPLRNQCKVKQSIDILGALLGLAITAAVAVPLQWRCCWTIGPAAVQSCPLRLERSAFHNVEISMMVVDADNLKHLVTNEAKAHFLRMTMTPELPASAASCGVAVWMSCLNSGMC